MKTKLLITSIILSVSIGITGCSTTYTPENAATEICESFKNMDLESMQKHGNSYFIGLAENKQKSLLKLKQKYYTDCSNLTVEAVKDGGDSYNYKFRSKDMPRALQNKFYLDTKQNTYTISF